MLLQTEAFDAHDQARLTFALQCTRGDPNDAGGSYDEGDERTRANVALLRSAAGGGITAALAKLLHGESESVRAYMHETKAQSKTPKKGKKKGRTAASPRPNEAKLALLLKIIGGLFIDVEAEAKDFAGAAFVLSSAFIAGASPARKRARRGAAARSAHSTTHNALAALATLAAHDAYSRAIRAACVATAKDLVLSAFQGETETARVPWGANTESAAAIETFASLFIDVVETPAVLLELAELLAFVERAGALDAKSELKTTHVVLDVDGACASGARSTAVNSVAIATALKRTLAAQRGPRGAATYRFDDVVAIEIVRVVLEARVERCALRCAGGGASHVAARIAAHAVFSVTLRSTKKEEKIGHGVCYVSVAGLGVSILGGATADGAVADADAILHLAWGDINTLEFTSDISRSLQLTLRPRSTLLEEWRPAVVETLVEGASKLLVECIRLEFIAPSTLRRSTRAFPLSHQMDLPRNCEAARRLHRHFFFSPRSHRLRLLLFLLLLALSPLSPSRRVPRFPRQLHEHD